MGRGTTVVGVILLVLGILLFFGGVGADDTETATTCYEGTYSSGCVETEYQNPASGMGLTFVGVGLSFVGLILTVTGGRSSTANSGVSNDLKAELEERQRQR
jgi:uncharacterized membrane protein